MWLSTAWSSGELVPGTSGLTLFSIILRGRWNWFLIVAWPALEPRGLSSSRSIGSRESKRESKREREREREKDTPPPLKAEAAAATPVSSLVDRPRSPPTQSSFSLSLYISDCYLHSGLSLSSPFSLFSFARYLPTLWLARIVSYVSEPQK